MFLCVMLLENICNNYYQIIVINSANVGWFVGLFFCLLSIFLAKLINYLQCFVLGEVLDLEDP